MCVIGPILRSYAVADKIQAVTHDEDISPEEDEEEDSNRWRCIICGRADQEDVLLLCDNCNDAYHTHCLDIDGIPEGDWFCPNCIAFTNVEWTRPISPPSRHARTAIQTILQGPRAARRGSRQSRRRQLQQQQWDRAWASLRDRTWEQLNADVREDEALEDIRGLTQRQEEERIRWMNRLSRSNNSGAAYLRATRSESGQSNRGDTPPAAMSDPEEDRAWSLFEAAKSSVERSTKRARRTSSREDTPASSRNATPRTPVRSPPAQTRRLKRPRTRRVTPPAVETQSDIEPKTPVNRRASHVLDTERKQSGGTFLQGLLENINRPKSPGTPLDSTVLTPAARSLLFGPSPPHSPPLLPTTSSPIPADSFPSLSDLLPVSPEPIPRHRSSSPSFAVKSHIQQLVSQALKPHYRSGQVTRDQFTEINKKICRKLYEVVERGETVEGLVTREVEREVDAVTKNNNQSPSGLSVS